MKIPLFVEVIGEPAVGKTHFAAGFPRVFFIDTTPKAESLVVVRKVIGEEFEKRWVNCPSFEAVRKAVGEAVKREDVATVVVDTSSKLQEMAKAEWLRERKGRERPLPFEYVEIREKIDRLIEAVVSSGRNLVFTSVLKDEYDPSGKKTGRRIRDGYVKTPYMVDLMLKIVLEDKGNEVVRRCLVLKNRFRDRAGKEWIGEIEPSWSGVVKATGLGAEEVVV
ncbi:MAG: AAA family ATPase [Candidatus Hadarchaeales archaeon]